MKKLKTAGALLLVACMTASLASCQKSGADQYNWQTVSDDAGKTAVTTLATTVATQSGAATPTKEDMFKFSFDSNGEIVIAFDMYGTTQMKHLVKSDLQVKGNKNLATSTDFALDNFSCKGNFLSQQWSDYAGTIEEKSRYTNMIFDVASTTDGGLAVNTSTTFGEEAAEVVNQTYAKSELYSNFVDIFDYIQSVERAGEVATVPSFATSTVELDAVIAKGVVVKTFTKGTKSGIRYELTSEGAMKQLTGAFTTDATKNNAEFTKWIEKIEKGVKEVSYSLVYDSESKTFEEYSVTNLDINAPISMSFSLGSSSYVFKMDMQIKYKTVVEVIGAKTIGAF